MKDVISPFSNCVTEKFLFTCIKQTTFFSTALKKKDDAGARRRSRNTCRNHWKFDTFKSLPENLKELLHQLSPRLQLNGTLPFFMWRQIGQGSRIGFFTFFTFRKRTQTQTAGAAKGVYWGLKREWPRALLEQKITYYGGKLGVHTVTVGKMAPSHAPPGLSGWSLSRMWQREPTRPLVWTVSFPGDWAPPSSHPAVDVPDAAEGFRPGGHGENAEWIWKEQHAPEVQV